MHPDRCLRAATIRRFTATAVPALLFVPALWGSATPIRVPHAATAAAGSLDQVLRENALFFNMLTTLAFTAAIVEPTWQRDVKNINMNLITRDVRDQRGRQIVRVRVAGVVRKNNNVELDILDLGGALVGKGFLGFESGQVTFFDRAGTPIVDGLMDGFGRYTLSDLRLQGPESALALGDISGYWDWPMNYAWYSRQSWSVGGGKLAWDRFTDSDPYDSIPAAPRRMYWTFESGRLDESTPACGFADYELDTEITGSINSVLFDTARTAESFFIHPYSLLPDPEGIAFLPRLKNGTGVAVANTSDREISVTYIARRFDGSLVQGKGIENPVTYLFPPRRQFAAYPDEIFEARGTITRPLLFADDEVGWLEVRSDDGKIQAMYLEGDDRGYSMDGNVAAQSGDGPLIFTGLRAAEGEVTEISILNLAYDPLTLRAELLDREGIVVAEDNALFIAGRGLRTFSLYPGLSFLSAPDPKSAASLRIGCAGQSQSSNCGRLVALATYQDRFGSLSTSFAISSTAAGTALVGPYFVVGPSAEGEWITSVRVTKMSGDRGDVRLDLYDADGNFLWSSQQSIPPGGQAAFVLDPAGLNGAARRTAGSLRLASSSGPIAGDVTVSWTDGRGSVISNYQLANALCGELQFNQVAVGVAGGIEYWTGVGLLNDSEKVMQVRLDVFLPDGNLDRSVEMTLQPHQQMATLLTQLLGEPGYKRVNGYMRVVADNPIAGIVFYGDSQNRFLTTVPGIQP